MFCSMIPQRLRASINHLFGQICSLLGLTRKEQPSPRGGLGADPGLARLFAVIIGIDKYNDPKIRNLRGAVADAEEVSRFLKTKLGVPSARIVSLHNGHATRSAMKKALSGLATDPDITEKDPILIFFAGHGAEAKSPLPGWGTSTNDGKIQMLLPVDFSYNAKATLNAQGFYDMLLSDILENIAEKKSDNITVILDCCHSGSGTRVVAEHSAGTALLRRVELPCDYAIPLDIIHQEFGNNRGSEIPKQFQKGGLMSHVLLAACSREEQAQEAGCRGVFTVALLDLLQREGSEQLTYHEIIKQLPVLSHLQNPQCEGQYKNRIIFKTEMADRNSKEYDIRPGKSGAYFLAGGEVHGITRMAKFDVYLTSSRSRVGSVIATEVGMAQTTCSAVEEQAFSVSSPAYAVMTHSGIGHDIRVQISDVADPNYKLFAEALGAVEESRKLYRRTTDRPDLCIRTNGASIYLDIMDEKCRSSGLTHCIPLNIPAKQSDLSSVLCSATNFYRHLHHGRRLAHNILPWVDLECLKLVPSTEHTPELMPKLTPEPNGANLIIDEQIHIDVNENAIYGYRITNRSTRPLFAALFFFNMSDMSIVEYYKPQTAKLNDHVDVSILPSGTLNVGFGDSGTMPREYTVEEDQTVDFGYLKLYLSTRFVDYECIAQCSPFPPGSTGRGDKPHKPPAFEDDLWDTTVIPVLQRKGTLDKVKSG